MGGWVFKAGAEMPGGDPIQPLVGQQPYPVYGLLSGMRPGLVPLKRPGRHPASGETLARQQPAQGRCLWGSRHLRCHVFAPMGPV